MEPQIIFSISVLSLLFVIYLAISAKIVKKTYLTKVHLPGIFFDQIKEGSNNKFILPVNKEYDSLLGCDIIIVCKRDHIKEKVIKRVICVEYYPNIHEYIISCGLNNLMPKHKTIEECEEYYSNIKYKDEFILSDINISANGGISVISVITLSE